MNKIHFQFNFAPHCLYFVSLYSSYHITELFRLYSQMMNEQCEWANITICIWWLLKTSCMYFCLGCAMRIQLLCNYFVLDFSWNQVVDTNMNNKNAVLGHVAFNILIIVCIWLPLGNFFIILDSNWCTHEHKRSQNNLQVCDSNEK